MLTVRKQQEKGKHQRNKGREQPVGEVFSSRVKEMKENGIKTIKISFTGVQNCQTIQKKRTSLNSKITSMIEIHFLNNGAK